MSSSGLTGHPPATALDPQGRDHHGQARLLREAGPVVPVLLPGAPGREPVPAWAVTTHAELTDLLRDERISKDYRRWTAYRQGMIGPDSPIHGMLVVNNLVTADGAEHARLRRPLGPVLSGRPVNALVPRITETAQRLLGELEATAEGGVADLALYAERLPLEIIAAITGVGDEHFPRLRRLVSAIFSSTMGAEEAERIYQEIPALLTDIITFRAAHPGDDMTSALLEAQKAGRLDGEEVAGTLWVLLTAGHETARGLILNAVRALTGHPEQLAQVLDGSRTFENAVEETLRWDPPITNFMARYPTEQITIAGVTLEPGEGILAAYLAAGRDPARYEDAEAFDLSRPRDAGLLSFGGGPHVCPGSRLAHLETAIALREFFTRWPGARPAAAEAELVPVPSVFTNSVAALPVTLAP
ncbi:cytochrome P450 [Actinocorallia aurea]